MVGCKMPQMSRETAMGFFSVGCGIAFYGIAGAAIWMGRSCMPLSEAECGLFCSGQQLMTPVTVPAQLWYSGGDSVTACLLENGQPLMPIAATVSAAVSLWAGFNY